MKNRCKVVLIYLMLVAALGMTFYSLGDEKTADSRTLSILSVEGDHTYVIRGSSRELKASAGIPLGQGSRVRTGKKSSMYLEADADQVFKLGESSQAEITKASAKKLRLTLKSGKLFFNVENPLEADEELRFDAAQTSMSIRGTCGSIDLSGDVLQFDLIDGLVDMNVGNEAVSLVAGDRVTLVNSAGDPLAGSGMSSAFVLQSIESFTWEDLDEETLRAVIEQWGKIDLGKIGLDSEESLDAAEKRLEELVQEREEAERRAIQEAKEAEEQRKRWEQERREENEQRDTLDEYQRGYRDGRQDALDGYTEGRGPDDASDYSEGYWNGYNAGIEEMGGMLDSGGSSGSTEGSSGTPEGTGEPVD